MGRPTRKGTLIESKWKYGTRLWTLAMEADIDASMQSEFVLIPAPDTCPNRYCVDGVDFDGGACEEPGCNRGYVWPDNLVERLERAWLQMHGYDIREWLGITLGVLFVEVDDE